jgi:hypothetical protein
MFTPTRKELDVYICTYEYNEQEAAMRVQTYMYYALPPLIDLSPRAPGDHPEVVPCACLCA